jgi:hypothetical protein
VGAPHFAPQSSQKYFSFIAGALSRQGQLEEVENAVMQMKTQVLRGEEAKWKNRLRT